MDFEVLTTNVFSYAVAIMLLVCLLSSFAFAFVVFFCVILLGLIFLQLVLDIVPFIMFYNDV